MDPGSRILTLLDYIHAEPGDPFTKYLLALEYVKSGNEKEAFDWMKNIHENHPDYLPNYYHYGKLLERLKKNDAAEKIYTEGMNVANGLNDHHTFQELKGAHELLLM